MYDALLIRYRRGFPTFQKNFKLNEGVSVSAQWVILQVIYLKQIKLHSTSYLKF